jgi:hypothetical protein
MFSCHTTTALQDIDFQITYIGGAATAFRARHQGDGSSPLAGWGVHPSAR